MDKKVSLMIYGNPQSNAGYQPIFYINDPTFTPPVDLSPGGMNENDYYFTVKISQAFTNVTLIQNNVSSAGASRAGILKIAMAVPKDMRLKDGKTPYDVLKAVRDQFVANYMDPLRGAVTSYRYKAVLPDKQLIEDTVAQFTYEDARLPHREMKGTGTAFLQTTRMEEFFSDVQYPEFERYGEIIVAQQGIYTPRITVPAIPRRPNWTLVVNNRRMQWPGDIKDIYTERISIPMKAPFISPNIDPKHYDLSPLSFTITDARAGRVPEISVDEVQETVNVSLTPKPKTRVVKVMVEGVNDTQKALKNLEFFLDGQTVRVTPQGEIRLSGPQITGKLVARYRGTDYNMTQNEVADNLIIKLEKKKSISDAYGGADARSKVKMTIAAPLDKTTENMTTWHVKVTRYEGSGKVHYVQDCSLSTGSLPTANAKNGRIRQTDNSEYKLATLMLPGYYAGQINVSVRGNGKEITDYGTSLKPDQDNIVRLMSGDFRPVKSKGMEGGILFIIGAFVVGILLGVLSYWGLGKIFSSSDEEQQTEQMQQGELPEGEEGQTPEDWWEDDAEWNEIEAALNREDITFKEIYDFGSSIQNVEAIGEAKDQRDKHSEAIRLVKDYVALVKAIQSGNIDDIKQFVKNERIAKRHKDYLREIYWGWYDGADRRYKAYQGDGVKNAKSEFASNAGVYTSFKELGNLHEGKREDVGNQEAKALNRQSGHSEATPSSPRVEPAKGGTTERKKRTETGGTGTDNKGGSSRFGG